MEIMQVPAVTAADRVIWGPDCLLDVGIVILNLMTMNVRAARWRANSLSHPDFPSHVWGKDISVT